RRAGCNWEPTSAIDLDNSDLADDPHRAVRTTFWAPVVATAQTAACLLTTRERLWFAHEIRPRSCVRGPRLPSPGWCPGQPRARGESIGRRARGAFGRGSLAVAEA